MKRDTATETYLKRATRGLWGRKQREIREELEAHMYDRIRAHRIAGLSEADAIEKALTELGSPQQVSVGMARLYTLPTVMGSSVALITLCLAVVALWPKGMAQTLEGTFYYPTQKCLEAVAEGNAGSSQSGCVSINDEFWVDIDALKKILSSQGVVFETDGFAAGMLRISVPGSTSFFIEPYPRESVLGIGALARGYVPLWNVIERFAQAENAHLKISGWDNPSVTLNGASFRLSSSVGSAKGKAFYQSYLSVVLDRGLTVNRQWGKYKDSFGLLHHQAIQILDENSEKAFHTTRFAVGGEPGDVYGFVTLIDPESTLAQRLKGFFEPSSEVPALYHLDITRLKQDGTVTVQIPDGTFRLVEDVSFPNVKAGDSVLVRLAGGDPQTGGWYEIVSPERIKAIPY